MNEFNLPSNLQCALKASRRDEWLSELAVLIRRLVAEWRLVVGEPFQPGGTTAWVAPARDEAGNQRVLKISWRHFEAEDEARGLELWEGQGTVRVYKAVTTHQSTALLLERCLPGASLAGRPEPEQDNVVTGLLRRLWAMPTGHGLRPLSDMCERWAQDLETKLGWLQLDPGLVRAALQLWRELPASAAVEVLLATDLHAGNVLSAEREPWLAIDPKPFVGDPTYDILQHMLNCEERLLGDPIGLIDRMCDLLELDRGRLRSWLFARALHEVPRRPVLARLLFEIAPG